MRRTRRDIWKLGADWSETTLWYARAVQYLSDRHAWFRLAKDYAADVRKLRTVESTPSTRRRRPSHFLSWHRACLARFEATVARLIAQLGGPPDWALPYWNYSDRTNPHARSLPPVFAFKLLPDGSANPLRVDKRHGAGGGFVVLTSNDVQLSALLEDEFLGRSDGGGPGFGGCVLDGREGFLEQAPHDVIHGRIGGRGGLMSSPEDAAIDPVFWVHHANIDRLWQIWLNRNPEGRISPRIRQAILEVGRTLQASGDPAGHVPATAILDSTLQPLESLYEDVADPFDGISRSAARASVLAPPCRLVWQTAATAGRGRSKRATLLAVHEQETRLEGGIERISLRLEQRGVAALAASYACATREPDRLFVALEDITGRHDAAIFEVYIDLPPDAVPSDRSDRLAGVVSLFGVRALSRRSTAPGRKGLHKVLEATQVFDRLHCAGGLPRDELAIQIVPTSDIRHEDKIRIRRICLWRQGSR